ARHRHRAVPRLLARAHGDQGAGTQLAVLRPPAQQLRFLLRGRACRHEVEARAHAAHARLVARQRAQDLRAGPHARSRPRSVGLARRGRLRLRLRRRQAHGQGRRTRAHRRGRELRHALVERCGRLRRRAEEERPLSAGRVLNAMTAPVQHGPAVRTTCPYCGVGCGLIVQPNGQGGAAVVGDPAHPANFARICSKGSALDETLGLEGRLLHPMLRAGDGALARVGWEQALDQIARGFQDIVARHGPGSVAFYLSGQLLTEDYYVANKLMKGFLGSANVDTNSRLCMASSVAGHRRAFGSDTVPGTYADLDEADLIVLVGSNAAWCHPVLFQRIMRNKAERGACVAVIDPRRTVTADEADLFLPIAPGADTALFCGLLVHLAETRALDRNYIARHTTGFDDTLAHSREIAPDIETTARATGLPAEDVARLFDLFRSTTRLVTRYSHG